MEERPRLKRRLTSFQIIILGFSGVILLGALLLLLPFATRGSGRAPFATALFTSTSAVCVTGLVLQDTAAYWSPFGQAVILALIQIGGLGVVTVAASFAILSGKRISLMQRSTMQEALSAPQVGGIVGLTGFILRATVGIEALGALLMAPVFCRDYGLRGLWLAVFHSVSAFCNAGFDLMGTNDAPFVSLTRYTGSLAVSGTVMLLIVIGGIGFLTWEDVARHRLQLRRYRLQSKVILATTALLIALPAALFFFRDLAGLPLGERLTASLFQSVTPRTAGFNTVPLDGMTEGGQAVLILLMLIGGSPGSTAGGFKTTTFAVLLADSFATFARRREPNLFGRRIGTETVRQASTVLILYLTLFFGGGLILHAAEGLPLRLCLFETASAVGTVGLTLGITPQLGTLSQAVLIGLMFFGRVGGLTLIYAAVSAKGQTGARLPLGQITVG